MEPNIQIYRENKIASSPYILLQGFTHLMRLVLMTGKTNPGLQPRFGLAVTGKNPLLLKIIIPIPFKNGPINE